VYGIMWMITRYDEPNSAGMDGHLGDTSTARSSMLRPVIIVDWSDFERDLAAGVARGHSEHDRHCTPALSDMRATGDRDYQMGRRWSSPSVGCNLLVKPSSRRHG
jgi:hypothetical protein